MTVQPVKGGSTGIVHEMSMQSGEPDWMRKYRLRSLENFRKLPVPRWGGDVNGVDFDEVWAHLSRPARSVDRREPRSLDQSGGTSHNEAEVVQRRNRKTLEDQGVVFTDMASAVRDHPEHVRAYFGKIVPLNDNKFSALNSAVWRGGSFVYVPPGVEVEVPLQVGFGSDAANVGPFERTLIIADEGAIVHYIEGCSAPVYSTDNLHAAVVEIMVRPGAHVTYTTMQNWSANVYNLVTKRAVVEAEGHMKWVDGHSGSRLTMTYPGTVMTGPKASAEVFSVAYAGRGQQQDVGAKMRHVAPETTSKVISRTLAKNGGRSSYRSLVRIDDGAEGCASQVRSDGLVLDGESTFDASPRIEVGRTDAVVAQDVAVSRVGDDQLFYLMSRGLAAEQSLGVLANAFIEPITRSLPLEYAVEWNRLIDLQLEDSVG